ncbi:hypothetical protein GCM10009664_60050 [Kitasatospora gansuensis]
MWQANRFTPASDTPELPPLVSFLLVLVPLAGRWGPHSVSPFRCALADAVTRAGAVPSLCLTTPAGLPAG